MAKFDVAALAALLADRPSIDLRDHDADGELGEDALRRARRPRSPQASKPTGVTVALAVAGKELEATLCKDGKLRLQATSVEEFAGLPLGHVSGLPGLLGRRELDLLIAVIPGHTDPRAALVSELLRSLCGVQELLDRDRTLRARLVAKAAARPGRIHGRAGILEEVRSPELTRLLAVLGVSADAAVETVRARYRELVKQYHPDASTGSDARMKEINLAYARAVALLARDRECIPPPMPH